MKILAIDTATEACSAALLMNDEIIDRYELAPQQHTKLILKMIDGLLAETQSSLSQLNALTFTAGPGSFTGVRIATAIIQGLAYGADLPVIPISTLAILAQGAVRQFSASHILPAIDARMHQIYWGCYTSDESGIVSAIRPDSLSNPSEITVPDFDAWIGIGNGFKQYADTLHKAIGNRMSNAYSDYYPHAKDLLPLARIKYEKQERVTAETVQPIYLRNRVVGK